MSDKKEQQKEDEQTEAEHSEDRFTGSPGQQFPDLESEDHHERPSKKETSSDKQK